MKLSQILHQNCVYIPGCAYKLEHKEPEIVAAGK